MKWNSLPENLKYLENINLFKHKVKDHILETLNREDKNIYILRIKTVKYIKNVKTVIYIYIYKKGSQWK